MAENKEILHNQIEGVESKTIDKNAGVMIDLQKDREVFVPREVKSWMEKVEQETDQDNHTQQNEANGDNLLQPISKTPKILLPTSKNYFSEGFNKKIDDAGRWLSEFVFRLIKKNKGNVKFKEE